MATQKQARPPERGPIHTFPERLIWASTIWVALIGLTIIGLVGSRGVAAQTDDEIRRHGIFIESVEVSLVNVEVFATRDQEPVLDLTADDFEILVDGQPVEIANFSLVDRGSGRGTDGGHQAATDLESEPASVEPLDVETEDSPSQAGSSSEPITVIVMVDQQFLSPLSRKRVLDALTAELERLIDVGATIMIAAKSREEIEIEQDFTANPQQLLSALDRVAEGAPPNYSSEIRTTAELWDVAPLAVESRQTGPGQPGPALQTSEIDAQSAYQDARGVSQRIHADVTASLWALHRFLDALAGLPGRKSLVYVADELPVRPAELLWRIWWQEYGIEHGSRLGATPSGPSEFDSSLQLEALIADATASRVAFYPIGTDTGPDLASASSRGMPLQNGTFARATASSAGDGMRWLSERTGGRAALGAGAHDDFFGLLMQDLGSYYSLAFPSPHHGDGKAHDIEVRVRRPGIKLRHPIQYRDKSAEQRMADRTLSALTLGIEDNPLGVRVSVGDPKRSGKGGSKKTEQVTIPVEIHVPMVNLVLLPDAKSHRGKLSIQLVARDDRGRMSDPVVIRMPFEVAHRDLSWALTQTVDYATEMTVSARSGALAVGIHDDFGFTSSTVGVDLGTGSEE